MITVECQGEPVGGIAKLPLPAEAVSDTSKGSGAGTSGLATIAAAASAAALLLGGPAWYAGRRRAL